jgi:3',5'-cyclic AMP phosphodiesterase CpdA
MFIWLLFCFGLRSVKIMLLVQISDIHCGPMFNKQSFRTAIEEINAMSPDAVVVTGDLTEDGIQSQFKQAAKEERVNKRYSYKLNRVTSSKNDGNQKSASPTKEKGVRRKAS